MKRLVCSGTRQPLVIDRRKTLPRGPLFHCSASLGTVKASGNQVFDALLSSYLQPRNTALQKERLQCGDLKMCGHDIAVVMVCLMIISCHKCSAIQWCARLKLRVFRDLSHNIFGERSSKA
mmetsp:Transcript_25206/g.77695  ORF Transcript_25206/g.77695 Transcript_25206/m.77695 type:complete len:121 (+) Transcript_25206:164-526(+)